MDAMSNESEDVHELEISTPSPAVKYEKEEYESYVMSVAVTTLNLKELNILKGRYFDNKTCDDIGVEMGVSGTTISRWESEMLEKLRNKL